MDFAELEPIKRANRLLLLGLVGSVLLHAAVLAFWRDRPRAPPQSAPVELRLNASLTRGEVAQQEPAAAPAPAPASPPEATSAPVPEATPAAAQAAPIPPLCPAHRAATPVIAVPAPVGETPPSAVPNVATAAPPAAAPPAQPAAPAAETAPPTASMPAPAAAPGAGDSATATKSSASALTVDERAALATYRLHVENMIRHFDAERSSLDRTSWEGVSVMLLRVGADGGLLEVAMRTSSGDVRTDRQARNMILKSHKEVRIPKALEGKAFALELKLRFEAK